MDEKDKSGYHVMESSTEKLPMAMTMMGDIQLHANREAVWAKLNDPAVLKAAGRARSKCEKS